MAAGASANCSAAFRKRRKRSSLRSYGSLNETDWSSEYTLTAYGRTLRPALLELARWGQEHSRRQKRQATGLPREPLGY
jgi:DNA-binding HxlR family transcriptional regulator